MFSWIVGDGLRFRQSSELLPRSSHVLLERLAEFARDCPESRIGITGHTDAVGDASFNRALSLRRAAAVADYLVEKGVARERLVVAGEGEARPVADNATAWGRERNRRIEFVLLADERRSSTESR